MTRKVKLGVIEFNESFNPGLPERFFEVTKDLRDSASIVDVWLMDIATVLREFGYEMTITTNRKKPLTNNGTCGVYGHDNDCCCHDRGGTHPLPPRATSEPGAKNPADDTPWW